MRLFSLFLNAVLLVSGSLAIADDINFIQVSELPKEVNRSYVESGKATNNNYPQFPSGYGVDQALNDNSGESSCMAKIGSQLGPWTTDYEKNFYWTYTISAPFACLPPVTSTDLTPGQAQQLLQDLSLIPNQVAFEGTVLCYENLEDICDANNTTLLGYHTHDICEVTDLTSGRTTTLEDITDDSNQFLKKQGAIQLASELPLYVDYRRDDVASGHICPSRIPGKLKGLTRQAAHIQCAREGVCNIQGMIKESP